MVAIPTAVFYDHREAARSQVRFAFCKRPEVLNEALRGCPACTADQGPQTTAVSRPADA